MRRLRRIRALLRDVLYAVGVAEHARGVPGCCADAQRQRTLDR